MRTLPSWQIPFLSLMMPGVSKDAISNAQSVPERGNVLRTASDTVVELIFASNGRKPQFLIG